MTYAYKMLFKILGHMIIVSLISFIQLLINILKLLESIFDIPNILHANSHLFNKLSIQSSEKFCN